VRLAALAIAIASGACVSGEDARGGAPEVPDPLEGCERVNDSFACSLLTAPLDAEPIAMALIDDAVLVAGDDGWIRGFAKDGSGLSELVPFDAGRPIDLIARGRSVFVVQTWDEEQQESVFALDRIDLGGGPPDNVVRIYDQPYTGELAFDDEYVYWATYGPTVRVLRHPVAGAGAVEEVLSVDSDPAESDDGVASFSVDDTHLYWTVEDGRVYRRGKEDAGPPELLAVSPWPRVDFESLLVDAEYLYMTRSDDTRDPDDMIDYEVGFVRLVKQGGDIEPLVVWTGNEPRPRGPAHDDRYLYFNETLSTDHSNRRLYRLARSGGEPEALLSRWIYVARMEADDTGLFVMEKRQLMRVGAIPE
jgi:hypothetical protein